MTVRREPIHESTPLIFSDLLFVILCMIDVALHAAALALERVQRGRVEKMTRP